jgi:hypothetical protein
LRLYHRINFIILQSVMILFFCFVTWGCTAPQVTQGLITVDINADKKDIQIKTASGSTVQDAINSAQLDLGDMDRVEPPLYTVLSDNSQVKVIRVREEYYIEQEIIPFEHQELRNEALPEGDRRLSQPGVNGLEEITYHRVFEDNIEVSNNIIKTMVLQEAIPEVVMIGSRSAFASITIPGRLAYLSAGNAWVIDKSTGNRRLVVSTGDLDGRIFSLSKDGELLLFSRFSTSDTIINSIWLATLENDPVKLIDLKVNNVVHFADFGPDSSETAPGWQANNDLFERDVNPNGFIGPEKTILEPNSGGIYGWWGMEFSWAPDGMSFLYARPDGIGIIDNLEGTLSSIFNIQPYQTGGNWAWIPGTAWSPDGNVIYSVDHLIADALNSESTEQFDLIAIPLSENSPVDLVKNVGMFAYPVPSPIQYQASFINLSAGINLDQNAFAIAYLQAIFPDQSETSGYRLTIMDRDGSNQKSLFPEEGAVGLAPQQVVWSPEPISPKGDYAIAFIYNGNIWLVDSTTSVAQQITGDGLTNRIDWR